MNTDVLKLDCSSSRQKKDRKRKSNKSTVPSNSPVKSLRAWKRKETATKEEESIPIKRKNLHDKKKKVVSQLQDLHRVLGATRPPDEKEEELEQLIFGCKPEELSDTEDNVPLQNEEEKKNVSEKRPAWEDEDDKDILVKEKAKALINCHRSLSLRGEEKYSDYVQEKFIKLMGAPKWADLGREKSKDSDDSDDELLQKTGNFITKSEYLPKGNINMHKCASLIDSSMKPSIVKSVEFHPTSKVALVGTANGTANLFQIDGKINAKIQSIHFEDFPIETAHFTTDGREVIVGSRSQAHFFTYDMFAGKIIRVPQQKGIEQKNVRRFHLSPDGKYIVIHGRFGNIHLMTTKTKEWIGTLKMNGEVTAITFNRDGTKMYSHGTTGEVYIWDMISRKCVHKFTDLGCIEGTAMALSPNDQFLATGSDSGIVNVYDNKTVFTSSSPEPLKGLKNLTTEISHLKFNNTSEILSMLSFRKQDAIKLVHFPSLTVFSNFPTSKGRNPIRYTNSVDFSTNSGYFCIGNNLGTALMYRLKHYKNY